jgi:hypothetical protein
MENNDAVNCDFGDSAAGMHSPAFIGSPLYAQSFAGHGLDGLYAFPLGFYTDNSASRNLFQGLFSLVGTNVIKDIIKEGNNANIIEKLENGDKLTTEERMELENAIDKCRAEFEDNRTDSAKANELARKQRK